MRATIVIDASIVLHAVLNGPQRAECDRFLSACRTYDAELLAPTLYAYETTSALSKGLHFGSLTDAVCRQALVAIAHFPIALVPPSLELQQEAFAWTTRLQRAAAYDSFYLALAEHWHCDFWTADGKLARAVAQPWVKLVGTDSFEETA